MIVKDIVISLRELKEAIEHIEKTRGTKDSMTAIFMIDGTFRPQYPDSTKWH